MIESLGRYLPQDRLRALIRGESLPILAHGSALFADISGFTPLTEKFSQQLGARRGIETLTLQINCVYGALIGEVERYGGSVISFSGDAITCWFDENDGQSAVRALACAQGMQEAMRAFTDLSVKVAIGTGPVRRFAVGAPEIRLIDTLAGATMMRIAAAEHLTRPAEIILDEASVAALQPSVREWRTSETGERFAVVEPAPLPVIETAVEGSVITINAGVLKPWLLRAVYEREIQGHGIFLAELRPTVALFVRFMGINYDDDELAEEKLNAIICQVLVILDRYEGALFEFSVGDKGSYFYASFGAASAHEDDTRRAVQGAIEIDQMLSGLPYLASHQLGLSTGTMRTGAYGGPTRQSYGAMGDDVNLAARLMMVAAPGEILVSRRIQKAVADEFTFEPRPPLLIKGKAEPLPVFAVTGRQRVRAARLPEPTYRLPMIGRQAELALVDEKLKLALGGKGQVLGIVAEAGMGKSRLVAEIVRLAHKRGFVGYGGGCRSSGANTPYLVWHAIWQAFFDLDPEAQQKKQLRLLESEIEDRAPGRVEALPLLGLVLNLPLADNEFTRALEPQDRRGTLEALLEDCLKSAALETPLLVVLEDLHWIDPLSRDLLERLARVCENLPVCFVLAYRSSDMLHLKELRLETLAYFTRIELKDLTTLDAGQLIQAKLAQLFSERTGMLPKVLADELTAKAQGNPFYLEELLNYLHDRGINPFEVNALDSLELPVSLQTLILSRIDQLTEPQKITLKTASVIGRLFPLDWLLGYYPALGEARTVKANLEELSRLELTPLDVSGPEPAYIFKHIVTQEVAYESLSFATRARLHELLARFLESAFPDDPPLDALAFHYNRSENLPKKREYLLKCAEAAYAVYSNETALEYYNQALVLAPDADELVGIHLKAGKILQVIGKWDEADSHYRHALRVAGEKGFANRLVECQIQIGGVIELRGEYQKALEWLNNARELAEGANDPGVVCQVLIELGTVYGRLGKFDLALENFQRSLDLARGENDNKRLADAMWYLAGIHAERGDYLKASQYLKDTLVIRRELNDKRGMGEILLSWGTLYYYQGDYQAASQYLQEGLIFYREIGHKHGITITLNNLGNIFFLKGDYQTAQVHYRESLTLGREMDDRYAVSIALCSLGITAFQQGNYDEAEGFYTESLAISNELEYKVGLTLLYCYFGLLALARKQVNNARASFLQGLTIAHESGVKLYIVYNLIGCACASLAENQPALAVGLLSAAEANAKAVGFKIEPELLQPFEQAVQKAKDSLAGDEFTGLWEAGSAISLEEAVNLARAGAGLP